MTTQMGSVHIPEWTRGDRFRKAREETGLTREQFADELGIDRKTVTAYELGEHKRPMKPIVRAWALRCAVPYEWLQDGVSPTGPTGGGAQIPLTRE